MKTLEEIAKKLSIYLLTSSSESGSEQISVLRTGFSSTWIDAYLASQGFSYEGRGEGNTDLYGRILPTK